MIIYLVYIRLDFNTLRRIETPFASFNLTQSIRNVVTLKTQNSVSNYSKYTLYICGFIVYLAAVVFAMH